MDCPKCGASQDDGREDCVSCGIVFERWRNAQLNRPRRTYEAPMPAEEPQSSKTLVIALLLIVVMFGLIWTVKRRSARANANLAKTSDEILDRINNEGTKTRQRLREEAERMQQLQNQRASAPLPRPDGFTEAHVVAMLRRCSGFNKVEEIRFPKSYPVADVRLISRRYPEFGTAYNEELITEEKKDGIATLTFTTRAEGMKTRDAGNELVVSLGRRAVLTVTELTGDATRAAAKFNWNWEEGTAARYFRPLGNNSGTGTAAFVFRDKNWWLVDGAIREQGVTLNVCP